MRSILILVGVLFLSLCSCSEQEKIKNVEEKIEAPDEAQDPREVWQKPDLVMDLIGDLGGKTIADIGAETGYFSFRLLNKAKKVVAVEIDPDMILLMNSLIATYPDKLKEKFEARLALPDNPRFEQDEIDNVLIVNTISYISNRVDYFKTISKGLKPGGKIHIIDYKIKRLPIDAPEYSSRVHMHILEEELYSAGYKDISIDDTSLDYQYIIEAEVEK